MTNFWLAVLLLKSLDEISTYSAIQNANAIETNLFPTIMYDAFGVMGHFYMIGIVFGLFNILWYSMPSIRKKLYSAFVIILTYAILNNILVIMN